MPARLLTDTLDLSALETVKNPASIFTPCAACVYTPDAVWVRVGGRRVR